MVGKIAAISMIVLFWYALNHFASFVEWTPEMLTYIVGVCVGIGATWFLDVRVSYDTN